MNVSTRTEKNCIAAINWVSSEVHCIPRPISSMMANYLECQNKQIEVEFQYHNQRLSRSPPNYFYFIQYTKKTTWSTTNGYRNKIYCKRIKLPIFGLSAFIPSWLPTPPFSCFSICTYLRALNDKNNNNSIRYNLIFDDDSSILLTCVCACEYKTPILCLW